MYSANKIFTLILTLTVVAACLAEPADAKRRRRARAPVNPAATLDGDQSTFSGGVSGYTGGCGKSINGGNESAGGPKPRSHTAEHPGGGWAMAAVQPDFFSKLKGCEADINGVHVKVMDVCPICASLSRVDVSHDCGREDSKPSNHSATTVQWKNCKVNEKAARPAVQTINGVKMLNI